MRYEESQVRKYLQGLLLLLWLDGQSSMDIVSLVVVEGGVEIAVVATVGKLLFYRELGITYLDASFKRSV